MRPIWCSLAVLSGVIILAATRDPFHWTFDAALALTAAGLAGLAVLLLRRLAQSRHRLVRGVGVAGWIVAAALVAGAVVIAVDYRTIVFRPAPAGAWKADMDDLSRAISRLPARLRAHADRQTTAVLQKFIADLDGLDEDARHARLAEVVATLDDGHSLYFPFFPASSLQLAPVQMRFFDDGLFIVEGGGRLSSLAGSRITSLNGMTPDEAFQRIAPLVAADNDASRRQRATTYMTSPRLWHAMGAGARDAIALVLERGGQVTAVQIGPANRAKYLWWVARPFLMRREAWTIEERRESSALVVRLWRVDGDTRDALGALGREIVARAEATGASRIVIDLRENGGGDNTLLPPLVAALQSSAFNHREGLYVITGPGTFSAATNFVSLMAARTLATFVGGPTGSGPNHHGDSDHIILSRTRTAIFLSTRWHQFGAADDTRRSHMPHILVPDTSQAFFAGRDPALEAALRRD